MTAPRSAVHPTDSPSSLQCPASNAIKIYIEPVLRRCEAAMVPWTFGKLAMLRLREFLEECGKNDDVVLDLTWSSTSQFQYKMRHLLLMQGDNIFGFTMCSTGDGNGKQHEVEMPYKVRH
jgi:hypothetical protein